MKVEIICPLFNAEKYILNLHKSILSQKNVDILKISYVLTESNDRSEEVLNENNIKYLKIKKEEFSHSLVREKIAMASESDILVFVSQDIEIEDDCWLQKLVSPIEKHECEATYSRQISKFDNIEKYTRQKNYPEKSFYVAKNDVKKYGLKTFFFSDASSAIKTSIFKEIGGYDGKDLPTNEDMYIAYKIIMNGYKIGYCADSIVFHSHKLTLKQLYKRYYLTGIFLAENPDIDKFGTNKAGGGLAKYVFVKALKDFNIKVLLRFIPDMFARWFGMCNGKKFGKKRLKKESKNVKNQEVT